MSIYKLNNNDTTTHKIEYLNNMILELNGMIAQNQFDKIELDAVYDVLGSGYTRQYLRNQLLGNTLATYTGWTHLHAEGGYSIWKYIPTTYVYNAENQVFVDNKLLVNKGLANSETATSFTKVYVYDGAEYNDNTTEASSESGTAFNLLADSSDFIYCGLNTTFSGIKFEFATRGSGTTLKLEYWDGASWTTLTANTDGLVDNTSNFESDGAITFTIPVGWNTKTLQSGDVAKYYIRISSTSTPSTVASAYYIIPNNSVIGLLALSSTEIFNEAWAWCTYGSSIYVTIRNDGVPAYEGNYFITSSSSTTNKQNYFIYNHEFKANYQDSTY